MAGLGDTTQQLFTVCSQRLDEPAAIMGLTRGLECVIENSIGLRLASRKGVVMKKKLSATIVLAACAAATLPAWAADNGAYVGLSAGKADWKADSINGVTGDNSGTAGKVFGGYQFNKNLGLELGYADLGKFGGAGTGSARAHATSLDAVGMVPLGDSAFSAIGRVGVANTRTRTSIAGVDSSSSGSNLKAGLGVQYNLSKNAGVRAEWERYRAKEFGEKNNIDLATVGFVWGF
jgi:opacity protein-like surface antigen